jgi:Ion channel
MKGIKAITVEYGDIYPVTFEGTIVAEVLMFVGIDNLGILISTLGAALLESKLLAFSDQTKLVIKENID